MGYTTLNKDEKEEEKNKKYKGNDLRSAALEFICETCEKLRFDEKIEQDEIASGKEMGRSIKDGQIPYNMQMDIDRLCMENAIADFLDSGKREEAFDVYFCYLEMFFGGYDKTRKMIELLSEYEVNGSGLLVKHRDHYVHSVYVFILGLAVYQKNALYRRSYNEYYNLKDRTSEEQQKAAHHFLRYWGMTALFHDIGYPFELPFEQVESYFEVTSASGEKNKRENKPYIAYNRMDTFNRISDEVRERIQSIYRGTVFETTDDVFAHVLYLQLGENYGFDENSMKEWLEEKAQNPEKYAYRMDHAYFSATILFKKLFEEIRIEATKEHIDVLTAILMHNSLFKFKIASKTQKALKQEEQPLAYMLMLCDELQCWNRTAYGRKSKTMLYPMEARFCFEKNEASSRDAVCVTYYFDKEELEKTDDFKEKYIRWQEKGRPEGKQPELKEYSSMFIRDNSGMTKFQSDIEKIVDLSGMEFTVSICMGNTGHIGRRSYLSDSRFINLYNFAVVLHARWDYEQWEQAKLEGREKYIASLKNTEEKFRQLSLEYKLSNINQAKAFAKYMDEIGCFYTDRDVDFEPVQDFTEDELEKIGILEHQRWLNEHYKMGWTYGKPKKEDRELVRQHADMLPYRLKTEKKVTLEEAERNYKRLSEAEQNKDTAPMECMLELLKMYDGVRIYRLK